MEARPRPSVSGLASVALALALAALAGTVTWSFASVRRAHDDLASVTAVVLTYTALQNAVADQAYAEAAYRRAPGDAARAGIDAAAARVDDAVGAVRVIGDRTDRATLTYLLVLNRRYQVEVHRTLGRDAARADERADDRVAGPALDAVKSLLDASLRRHVAERDAVLAEQQRVLERLAWLLPAGLVTAVTALGLCWSALTRAHRRLGRQAAESEYRAGHDPLTGLANRAALTAAAEQELATMSGRPCAMLLLDLDRFKPVNDTWGHAAGDALLVAVAHAVSSAVRPSDLVARLGGDEFTVLLRPGTAPDVVAEKVLAALREVRTPDGTPVSASVGVAVGHRGVRSVAELLAAADAALYEAKALGRGQARMAVH